MTLLAMHLSEGILPVPWAVLGFLAAVPFVALGLRVIRARSAIEPRYKLLVAMVGAAVFVVSAMPVPVPTAGTCSHPCGTGLAAVLIGPLPTAVVCSIALLLQALFLAHGGLTTLGANIFSMGVVGAFTGSGVFHVLRACGVPRLPAIFAAALLADWATYATTAAVMAVALHVPGDGLRLFGLIVLAFAPTQIPLGILEGVVSMTAYQFVYRRRPELLDLAGGQAALAPVEVAT